jgi:hypothetical protein
MAISEPEEGCNRMCAHAGGFVVLAEGFSRFIVRALVTGWSRLEDLCDCRGREITSSESRPCPF